MSNTRRPISAITIPRLLVTVVFPAFGLGLVTTITRGGGVVPKVGNKMEASVARNASAIITSSELCAAPLFRLALHRWFSPLRLPFKGKVATFSLFRVENNPRTKEAEEISAKGIAPSSGRFK